MQFLGDGVLKNVIEPVRDVRFNLHAISPTLVAKARDYSLNGANRADGADGADGAIDRVPARHVIAQHHVSIPILPSRT